MRNALDSFMRAVTDQIESSIAREVRLAIAAEIDRIGGDGTSAFLSTSTIGEMISELSATARGMGHDDMLRPVARLSDADLAARIREEIVKHWNATPEPR